MARPNYYSLQWVIQDGVSTYHLAGGLYGFEAYVSIEIEARSFELHILEKDDPVHKFC